MTNLPAEPTSARRRGVWRRFGRVPVVAAAVIAAVIAVGATSNVGQTYALWSDTSATQPQVATAGAITATGSANTSAAAFSAGVLKRIDSATVTNTGTVSADYRTTTKVSNSAPSTFSSRLSVQVWQTTTAGVCNLPPNTPSYTWGAAAPIFTGTLAAKASVHYCALTTLSSPADLLTSGSVNASLETTLTRGSWTSTVSSAMPQTFSDAPPTAPTGLNSTGTTAFLVKLNWTASTDIVGVTGYEVFKGETLAATTSATTFTDSVTASPSTAYSYKIRAFDGAGNRSAFAPISVTTPAAAIPTGRLQIVNTNSGLCVNASAVGSQTLNQQVCAPTTNQSWNVTGPTAGFYTITSLLSSAMVWDVESEGVDNGAKVILYGAHQGANQQWRIVAVGPDTYQFVARQSNKCLSVVNSSKTAGALYNQQTCNAANPAQTFSLRSVPAGDTEPPTAPTNLAALASGSASTTLTWDAAKDNVAVSGYMIYRNGALIATTTGAVRAYSDSRLASNTSYMYTVRARDEAGNESPLSKPAEVTTFQSLTCAGSTDPRVLPGYWLTFAWKNAINGDPSVSGYHLYVNRSTTAVASVGIWESVIGIGPGPVHSAANLGSTVPVEVKKRLLNGQEVTIATGSVRLGADQYGNRLIFCGN